jgi:hypothetical protein
MLLLGELQRQNFVKALSSYRASKPAISVLAF